MVEREIFSWGVRLSVRPFANGAYPNLIIQSEISHYKPSCGSEIRITFSGVSVTPLRIIDAQIWREALEAIINETRSVANEMKLSAKPDSKSAKKQAKKPVRKSTKKS
jgi:hypothetical protein